MKFTTQVALASSALVSSVLAVPNAHGHEHVHRRHAEAAAKAEAEAWGPPNGQTGGAPPVWVTATEHAQVTQTQYQTAGAATTQAAATAAAASQPVSAANVAASSQNTAASQANTAAAQSQNPASQGNTYQTQQSLATVASSKTKSRTSAAQSYGSAAASPTGGSTSSGGSGSCSGNQRAVSVSGGSNMYYRLDGNWASGGSPTSGTLGSLGGTLCLPYSHGAMFISTKQGAASGSTKFECNFIKDGGGTSANNCDMSLVDGYSVAAKLTAQGGTNAGYVGGTKDLFSGNTCSDKSTYSSGSCKNTNGPSAHSAGALTNKFFNAGWTNSEYYCVFFDCGGNAYTFFEWDAKLTLSVSGSGPPASGY